MDWQQLDLRVVLVVAGALLGLVIAWIVLRKLLKFLVIALLLLVVAGLGLLWLSGQHSQKAQGSGLGVVERAQALGRDAQDGVQRLKAQREEAAVVGRKAKLALDSVVLPLLEARSVSSSSMSGESGPGGFPEAPQRRRE